ncbi:MAG: bifunctional diaminohydroxyphosphoribosylaminopyrimidine deaminase/5-amino-6-(5-phosphoribosylamino)uracil reductase RibD [Candidatus Omnitrophica bacterium]|nr:bifunctional diaminohydroxyphosphoribosylaminopyrimidine deaminase/5-amino-6-(5-phosphoribosylamino)uracil reductase RibD [Candidatus Omnitrophota bacterium]
MPNRLHESWMREALRLAAKGRFTVSPNPMVGACGVKAGRKVGEGFHEKYGGPHAEIHALRRMGKKSRGATLYVTLEPCSTWGKTPPCVAAIVKAGIRHVVVGSYDPNPKNHGRGIQALRKNSIKVTLGVLDKEVQKQNESFFKLVKTGLPFVTVKMAQSLDGKIAATNGSSRWISSPPARDFVHRLRAEQDAILIGKNTLLKDNPKLSPRIKIKNTMPGKPWRIVMDSQLEASPRARIFQGDQLTLRAASVKKIKSFKNKAQGILLPVNEKKGRLDLKDLLKKCAALGAAKILVEGGGETVWSLLNEGLVDKAYWIMAPKIIGGRRAKTSVEGEGVVNPNRAMPCTVESVSKLGEDWLFELKFKK